MNQLLIAIYTVALLCACSQSSEGLSDGAPDTPRADLDRVDAASVDLPPAADGAPDSPKDAPPTTEIGPAPDLQPSCPNGKWCSALYPPWWTPALPADLQGRFLHDVSFAGYHAGAKPIPTTPPGKIHDVVAQYSADNTGTNDATTAIQSAINSAGVAGGGIVLLPAGTYRCDGLLEIKADKVVLRGAGKGKTTLLFTRHQGMGGKSHLTVRGAVTRGPDIPLAQDGENRALELRVTALSGLKVGDEVAVGWVITPEFVTEHKMTGTWTAFAGQWKPIVRRTVVAVDASATPPRVTLDVPLRYEAKLRDKASLRRESGYRRECGVERLSLANAVKWGDAWAQSRNHVLGLIDCADCWVDDVHSAKSPLATGWNALDTTEYHLQSNGVLVVGSKRVTVAASSMRNAQNRGSGGNGYLFEISRSSEVLVRDCEAHAGRHNLIQNWDFGTSGCVFLRCKSSGSQFATVVLGIPIFTPAMCEYHHSLAMANLVDQCEINDGWQGVNRLKESSGAGHTSTQGVFWNTTGTGTLLSLQYGWGYIIGTGPQIKINTSLVSPFAGGTPPQDYVEGAGKASTLWPPSLYEQQLSRRLGP